MTIERLLSLFLEASICGSLLCILMLAAKRVRGVSPKVRYLLWSAVLFRFALPVVPGSSWSLASLWQKDETIVLVSSAAYETAPVVLTPAISHFVEPQIPWFTYLWVSGAIIFFAICFIQEILFRIKLSRTKSYTGPLIEEVRVLARKFGVASPGILEVSGSPALIGHFRPRLLLPAYLLCPASLAAFKAVAAHELAHLKRADILWNRVVFLVQAIHWFNPFVWLAVREWRRERELICDKMAVQILGQTESETYARTLLGLSRALPQTASISAVVNVVGKESEIKRRITMITKNPIANKWVTALIALMFGLGAGVAFTTSKTNEPPKEQQAAKAVQASIPEKDIETARAKVRAQQEIVKELSAEIRALRKDLGIPDEMIEGRITPQEMSAERYQQQLFDAQKDLERFQDILAPLKELTLAEALQVLPTLWKDDQLPKLVAQVGEAEIRLAELHVKVSKDHPDYKQAIIFYEQSQKQLKERFDGIKRGLQINCESLASRIKEINKKLVQKNEERRKVNTHYEDFQQASEKLRRAKLKLEAMETRLREIEVSNLTRP